MPISDYQSVMLPLLTFAEDRLEHSLRKTMDALAAEPNGIDVKSPERYGEFRTLVGPQPGR